jgi:hypothetical protein
MIIDYVETPSVWPPRVDDETAGATARGRARCARSEAKVAELEARLARAERILLLTDTRNQLRARTARQRPAAAVVRAGR